MRPDLKTFAFPNGKLTISSHLHLPKAFDDTANSPALVISAPGSSVKEQISAIYAEKLASQGFVVLTFDPSCQGASEGVPRGLEDPGRRIEDLKCAADTLTSLPGVDASRIGLLGICAGGGYAVQAALTDPRFKALGTVVATNIGAAFRRMLPPEKREQLLSEVAAQRTAQAAGADQKMVPWIPDSLEEADASGITDPDVLDAVAFYRHSAWRHENATNRLDFCSFGLLLGFDALQVVPDLLTQPLLVIANGRDGSTGAQGDSQALFDLAPSEDKRIVTVEGAGHYEMYHVPVYVDQAVSELTTFFQTHLVNKHPILTP